MTTAPIRGDGQFMAANRSTWYERNHKWFVPVLIVTALLLIVSFVGGIFAIVEYALRSSYPYKLAVKASDESPEVTAMIGSSMHVGWLATGQFNSSGPEGNVSLSIPLSGPRGHGDIIVAAKKHANRWTFESFEVDVEGHDQPIQLNLPESAGDMRPSKPRSLP
jgi:hypothetical protein